MNTDTVLLIDKPSGVTSFGVVARIRRVLSEAAAKKIKVGHTGTLDPFATGLMMLTVGSECKNASTYSKLDKVYEATIRLGQTSTTGDPEGEIKDTCSDQPDFRDIEQVLSSFCGGITQTPPVFSAIKIDGKRAYDRARAGEHVEMPPRSVTIYSLECVNYSYPNLHIRTHVSSGSYIRSLATDIGDALGTGGYCLELRRTSVGKWSVDDAKQLSDFGITS